MKIGLQIPYFTYPSGPTQLASELVNIARSADDNGLYSLWVMDHFFQIGVIGPPELEMLEAYSTLSFMGGFTFKIKLGAMVTGVTYRHPGVLIKTVTTLDVLTGGRAYLGIGAAWNEEESRGLGVPFPSLKERFERLDETLQIARQMWAGDDSPFNGQHYTLERPLNSPQPLTSPHPPILIGGVGEKKTLRLVAQYGDACNFYMHIGTNQIRHKLDVLKNHCADVGRNYDDIEKSTLGTVHLADGEMSAQQVIDLCGELAEAGIQHAIFNMPNVHEGTPLDIFGEEIIPAVESL